MLEIEGSDAYESSDESIRFLGETNPQVEGEVITLGEPDNPISVDDEESDDFFRQADIDEADRWMPENTAQIDEIGTAGKGEVREGQGSSSSPRNISTASGVP